MFFKHDREIIKTDAKVNRNGAQIGQQGPEVVRHGAKIGPGALLDRFWHLGHLQNRLGSVVVLDLGTFLEQLLCQNREWAREKQREESMKKLHKRDQ